MKKKMIIIFVLLVVLGVGGFFGWKFYLQDTEPKEKKEVVVSELSASEVAALTFVMGEKVEDIMTNTLNGNVSFRFNVVLENEKTLVEFQTIESRVYSAAIETARSFSNDKLNGANGKILFEKAMKEKFNSLLKEGKALEVWVTSMLVM